MNLNYKDVNIRIWNDVKKIKGIVHIIHGAQEHIGRYNELALFLNENKYIAIGCDNYGHGDEVTNKINNLYKNQSITNRHEMVYEYISKTYNQTPILLGHSMGSLIGRKLIDLNYKYDKVILTGPINPNRLLVISGLYLAKIIKLIQGKNKVSKLANELMFGKFVKQSLKINKSKNWLTTNDNVYKEFKNDKKCANYFDNNYIIELIKLTKYVTKNNKSINNENTIMMYGEYDVTSNCGKDLNKLIKEGINFKKYKNMRHEILKETHKQKVYTDILKFIERETHGN